MTSPDFQDSRIHLGQWRVTEEAVLRYLAAVGDDAGDYRQHRLTPPLALTAMALATLLEKLELPGGAIHSLQEVETCRGLAWGETVTGTATLQRPRQRGGLKFITASYVLTGGDGAAVQQGKTTVLAPSGGAE